MAARVVVTPPRNLGAVLVQATGSDAHLESLTAYAAGRGMAFTAAALWRGSEFVPTPDEAAFYRALGLAEIPPELREGGDEVARAAAGSLPALLVESDLAGFLHCHSSYSDGTLGIEELATACRDAGYAYVGLTDHSRSAAYAGGLSVDDLHRQWAEIDQVNARLTGIRVLKGIESDILIDGRLDYEDEVLAGFDFVIGSIHSRFAMGEADMTTRVLRALDSRYLTILGHPTGRLLLSRDSYRHRPGAGLPEGRGEPGCPRDQRRSPPAGPGLAGGRTGPGARGHDLDRIRRPQSRRHRLHAIRRGDGAERRARPGRMS